MVCPVHSGICWLIPSRRPAKWRESLQHFSNQPASDRQPRLRLSSSKKFSGKDGYWTRPKAKIAKLARLPTPINIKPIHCPTPRNDVCLHAGIIKLGNRAPLGITIKRVTNVASPRTASGVIPRRCNQPSHKPYKTPLHLHSEHNAPKGEHHRQNPHPHIDPHKQLELDRHPANAFS